MPGSDFAKTFYLKNLTGCLLILEGRGSSRCTPGAGRLREEAKSGLTLPGYSHLLVKLIKVKG